MRFKITHTFSLPLPVCSSENSYLYLHCGAIPLNYLSASTLHACYLLVRQIRDKFFTVPSIAILDLCTPDSYEENCEVSYFILCPVITNCHLLSTASFPPVVKLLAMNVACVTAFKFSSPCCLGEGVERLLGQHQERAGYLKPDVSLPKVLLLGANLLLI